MLDRVTEIVAHMIGVFHTVSEEERLRDFYDRFRHYKALNAEAKTAHIHDEDSKSRFDLERFDPNARQVTDAPTAYKAGHSDFAAPTVVAIANIGRTAMPDPIAHHIEHASIMPQGTYLTLEPPGGVVVLTFQYNYLSDDDVVHMTEFQSNFADVAVMAEALHSYHFVAQALAADLGDGLPPLGESTHDYAMQIATNMSETSDTGFGGASITTLHGAASFGSFENGQATEELAKLDDIMPAFLKAKADALDAQNPDPLQPGDSLAQRDAFEGLDSPTTWVGKFDIEPGHAVVTGANVLVNEAVIHQGWLDAPVIAVMGDVFNLNAISQVNFLVEHTNFSGIDISAPSVGINSATLSVVSSAPAPGEEHGAEASSGMPSNWAVTRIDGDLLAVNWVSQYSFITDHDRADVAFTSTNTYLGLGENTLVNITNLAELGYGYDLIIIGGNMISINQISQINVLIDNDSVSYSGIAPTYFSGMDNLLFNGASINIQGLNSYTEMQNNFRSTADHLAQGSATIGEDVAHDSVFEGVDLLRVLYISGDFTTINRIDQTNVLGDSDQVHLAMDNFADATGATVTITTGSNALINVASVNQYGVDSTIQVNGQTYDDALLHQAGFYDTDASPLGVSLPALVNEAVVFLADDFLGSDASDAHNIAPTYHDGHDSPDVMQTMLA
jgi:hypothetical protein